MPVMLPPVRAGLIAFRYAYLTRSDQLQTTRQRQPRRYVPPRAGYPQPHLPSMVHQQAWNAQQLAPEALSG